MDLTDILKDALAAFRESDFSLARDLCETILEQNPDNPGALRILGQVCYLEGDASCLDHQGSEKRAETLSSAQVRKPLYSTSIGWGKKFEQELAPFMAAFAKEAQ